MANLSEAPRKKLKQSQSMLISKFNMGELLRNTAQLLIGSYKGGNDQNVPVLHLFLLKYG